MRAAGLSGDTPEAGRPLRALPLSQPPDATELLLHGYGLFVTERFPPRARRPGPGHRRAAAARDEAEAIRQATGMEPGFGGDSGLLAALRDEERAATGHIEQLRREPGIGGVSGRAARLEHSLAVLYNGLARYPEALAAA
jgi:hypothetical protein